MTTNAQINQVVALLQIGELAMQMARADAEAKAARAAYHDEVKNFEEGYAGGRRIKVDPNDWLYAQRRLYTREEYLEFEAAKKKAYRAKRRLLKACEAMSNGGGM